VFAAMEESALTVELSSLFVIMAIAVGVPLAIRFLRIRMAEVVLLIVAGVVFGPQFLDLITIDAAINLLGELGLGFLFFLAGLELDTAVLRGRAGRLAAWAWGISLLVAIAVSLGLTAAGIVDESIGFAIVLTSTALGTLLPVLRDNGDLTTPFGRMFMGAGAWGEFGPIIAISVFLGTNSALAALFSLALFSVVALLVAFVPQRIRNQRIHEYLVLSHHTSSQTAVRITMLLLIALLTLAADFGLDIVMGAFIGGVILRRYLPGGEESVLQNKVEAIGFGFFIPVFFILSGVRLDVKSIIENPWPMLAVFGLLVLVRGLPTFILYRGILPDVRERTRLTLYTATGLPIIVAVTGIQVQAGLMSTNDAAELVAAGTLTVIVLPLLAQLLRRKDPQDERVDATA
jgi:Kef-type K+ transport system membrane component KefB